MSQKISTISTRELADRIGDPDLSIVDVRLMAAYNGWSLRGENRGGHIRGAVACPLSWTAAMKPQELKSMLVDSGVATGGTVVVYGYLGSDSAVMVEKLIELDCADPLNYEAGLLEWAADESLPMDRLANFQKLVYPQWLHERLVQLQGKSPLVFHVDFDGYEEYLQGHIRGAAYLEVGKLEDPSTGNIRSEKELESALLALGIRDDRLVVLYGRDIEMEAGNTRPGQLAAARAAIILLYAGVKDVRILDGGYDAWRAAGYEVDRDANYPEPVTEFGAPIPGRPDIIVGIDEVKRIVNHPRGRLVSVRSWLEFTGQTSGYGYIGPRGRIRGAVWGNSGSDAQHMQHFRNPENGMREYHQIERNWLASGITPDTQTAFYCGTGWRASEAFFDAYLMGWEKVAVYDGGWFEWSNDESNPIDTGEPPGGVW